MGNGSYECPVCGKHTVKWVKEERTRDEIIEYWECTNSDCSGYETTETYHIDKDSSK